MAEPASDQRPPDPSAAGPQRLVLRAGPVTCVLDGADLRAVRRGGRELAQRVYMAVRDEGWGTVPGTISDLEVDQRDDGFRVAFSCRHVEGAIDLTWRAEIVGRPDGTIAYALDGTAATAFRYAKIGFNVHHPLLETVGRRYRATRADGSVAEGAIAAQIEPQRVVDGVLTAMFEPYAALAIDYLDGAEARFAFTGDLFEMQDHRNWADGNFKSYGTPLSVPWPMDAVPGQRFAQALEIGSAGLDASAGAGGATTVVVGGPAGRARLPRLGLGRPTGTPPLGERARAAIGAARPEHLRVAVRLHDPAWRDELAAGVADCRALGAALELAVSSEAGSEEALAALAGELAAAGAPVARVLVLERQDAFTPVAPITAPATVERVRAALGASVGGAPFAGGSDQFFSDVNRDPPAPDGLDGVCFGLCPQVHAADDASLMENLAALPDCVETARTLLPGLVVAVSPVTLAARLGPFPAGAPVPGGPPGCVDRRLQGAFGGSWTLGAVAWLAAVATESATFFETVGDCGVAAPDGAATPALEVLAAIAARRDCVLHAVSSSAPLGVGALALGTDAGLRVLLANHEPEPRDVELRGLRGDAAQVRALDGSGAAAAPRAIVAGALVVRLPAYGVACLDAEGAAS